MTVHTLSSSLLVIGITAVSAIAQEVPIYPTPQAALDNLIAAMETGQSSNVLDVISPDAADLLDASEEVKQTLMSELLSYYDQGWRFVSYGQDYTVIQLGEDAWPFPIPLTPAEGGWRFDLDSARAEIKARGIGLNELAVIELMDAYHEIQSLYRAADYDGDGIREFASHVISTEGSKDGLYWPGEDSFVGPAAAQASLDGFADGEHTPLLGYYYRILTSQGASAPGGAMDYMINGNLLGGHALLAVPADYGTTGVHSFLISETGIVYEADLGVGSLDVGYDITSFDPGPNWAVLVQ